MPPSPPSHVAIIMDGNGRWATKRMLPRKMGHRAGIDAVRRTVRQARKVGIKVLTLYSFSSENWSRPAAEVRYLMDLFRYFFRREIDDLHANGVCVRFIGARAGLDNDILRLMAQSEDKTAGNTALRLNIAINYGSQQELALAAHRLIEDYKAKGKALVGLSPTDLTPYLHDPEMPDPEIVIRTGGDQRISNFLLWQSVYSELYTIPLFWPDFQEEDLDIALAWYAERAAKCSIGA